MKCIIYLRYMSTQMYESVIQYLRVGDTMSCFAYLIYTTNSESVLFYVFIHRNQNRRIASRKEEEDIYNQTIFIDFGYSIWFIVMLLTGCSILKHYWKLRSFEGKMWLRFPAVPQFLRNFQNTWSFFFSRNFLSSKHMRKTDTIFQERRIVKSIPPMSQDQEHFHFSAHDGFIRTCSVFII